MAFLFSEVTEEELDALRPESPSGMNFPTGARDAAARGPRRDGRARGQPAAAHPPAPSPSSTPWARRRFIRLLKVVMLRILKHCLRLGLIQISQMIVD